jgi:hypothetical protein
LDGISEWILNQQQRQQAFDEDVMMREESEENLLGFAKKDTRSLQRRKSIVTQYCSDVDIKSHAKSVLNSLKTTGVKN